MSNVDKLEEEYCDIVIGKVTLDLSDLSKGISESDRRKVSNFIDYISKRGDEVERIKLIITTEWKMISKENFVPWLEFYEQRLKREIRNLKLDKLC